MQVRTAQLPGTDRSDDRVFVTDHAVVMLDGASAFLPVPVPASVYAEHLGTHLRDGLHADPTSDLRTLLRSAIERTAQDLDLSPVHSPSSTVTIVRELEQEIHVLLLGDGLVVLPGEELTDDRIGQLGTGPRRRYHERLASGHGYDAGHRDLLRELQTEQVAMRNQAGGYWIAEADPTAADHAVVVRRSRAAVPWAVLATDGAYDTMRHLGLDDWPALVEAGAPELADILNRCHHWEAQVDPDGQSLPRAKRHDDKSLAVLALHDADA